MYRFIRDVSDREQLENGHYYSYNIRVHDFFGNGFADLNSEQYLNFTEDVKLRLYEKGLHIFDIKRIDDFELEFTGKYTENSVIAIAIIIVIGLALAVFGLWIIRHNIKEVAVAGGIGFSFGILIILGVLFFGLFKQGKG